MLADDRLFDPNPDQKALAIGLYDLVRDAPIVSPHGHIDPAIFSLPDYNFPNPAALMFQSDHYILRMLYSQGLSYEILLSQQNPQQAWRLFAENFHLFSGTPSGLWITHELEMVFGITERLRRKSAQRIYDQIHARLSSEEFTPRNLFQKFNIEVLATTDEATASLNHHQAIRVSGWNGKIIPTFRPDDLLNMINAGWRDNIETLSQITGMSINQFSDFIEAIEDRRAAFRSMGATATDLSVPSPKATRLSSTEINHIFKAGLNGKVSKQEADQFRAHMVVELARMSSEDGMVMQIHSGVVRNYNPHVHHLFGQDVGFDIPITTEFTINIYELLRDFGNHPNFHLILFTLDESTYSRELAPLAGAYPSVKIGPPWWFMDSWNGIKRYFDSVMETAGLYNTAGFNDDTRAFLSIPVRHDVWRRASANWLAGLLVRRMIDEGDAGTMMTDLAYGLAKSTYHL